MGKRCKRQPNKRRRILAVLCGILLFVVAVLGALEMGVLYTGNTWKHWYADYEKVEIAPLLEKEELGEEEYGLLYRQTGLTRLAIDDMCGQADGRARILQIQEIFVKEQRTKRRHFAPFTYMDVIEGSTMFCDLKDGDIIVSATTSVSWWRYGHACIVVDGKLRLIAEAVGPGTKSELANASVCDEYADFLVLRPKVDEQTKEAIARYVKEEMLDVPYRFTVGILSKKYKKEFKATQCAHFVWYAYKKFGIDLDSNGGGLVKPQDIALSSQVELVQAFGFDLEKLWS